MGTEYPTRNLLFYRAGKRLSSFSSGPKSELFLCGGSFLRSRSFRLLFQRTDFLAHFLPRFADAIFPGLVSGAK